MGGHRTKSHRAGLAFLFVYGPFMSSRRGREGGTVDGNLKLVGTQEPCIILRECRSDLVGCNDRKWSEPVNTNDEDLGTWLMTMKPRPRNKLGDIFPSKKSPSVTPEIMVGGGSDPTFCQFFLGKSVEIAWNIQVLLLLFFFFSFSFLLFFPFLPSSSLLFFFFFSFSFLFLFFFFSFFFFLFSFFLFFSFSFLSFSFLSFSFLSFSFFFLLSFLSFFSFFFFNYINWTFGPILNPKP